MSEIKEIIEEWRDITGYEGYYQVSNLGQVRGLDRVIEQIDRFGQNIKRLYKGKILKARKDKYGYLTVMLHSTGEIKLKKVHRLVAEAFIPIPDELKQYIGTRNLQVNHKDEDKTNNCVENLEYCTHEYNSKYGTRGERIAEKMLNGKLSKPVYQYTLDNELVAIWPSTNEAGRNGFHQSTVSACCLGKEKQHKGFIWSYTKL